MNYLGDILEYSFFQSHYGLILSLPNSSGFENSSLFQSHFGLILSKP